MANLGAVGVYEKFLWKASEPRGVGKRYEGAGMEAKRECGRSRCGVVKAVDREFWITVNTISLFFESQHSDGCRSRWSLRLNEGSVLDVRATNECGNGAAMH